jgi:cyclopropane fatty-acyl-phospholipid synthase-like methyltransferase
MINKLLHMLKTIIKANPVVYRMALNLNHKFQTLILRRNLKIGYKRFSHERQNDFDFLISLGLKRNHKILDLGCGGGRIGIPLLSYLDSENYYGLDKEGFMVDEFRQSIRRAKIDKGYFLNVTDIANIPDVRFNFIYAYSVFTHLPIDKLKKIANNAHDKLEKNGTFVFSFLLGRTYVEAEAHEDRVGELQGVWYSLEDLRSLAEACGFEMTFCGSDEESWEGIKRNIFDPAISTRNSASTWSPFWLPECDTDECGVGSHTHGAHQEMVIFKKRG